MLVRREEGSLDGRSHRARVEHVDARVRAGVEAADDHVRQSR